MENAFRSLADQTIEEKREFVSNLNLVDDTFCSVVLKRKEACEYLLSVLLGRKIEVVENYTQHNIRSLGNHGAVLDALVKDSNGVLYNVEVNTYDEEDHAYRIRYYSSLIDGSSLGKGKRYKDLRDLYMIYITLKDLFADKNDKTRKNRNHYEIKQYVDGINIPYDNGLHIHYFNTEVKDEENPELTELLEYLRHSDPGNNKFGALSETVNYYKYENEGVSFMCKFVEDYAEKYAAQREQNARAEGRAEGIAEGRAEGKIEVIKNLLKNNFSLGDALKFVDLDLPTYEKYVNEQ